MTGIDGPQGRRPECRHRGGRNDSAKRPPGEADHRGCNHEDEWWCHELEVPIETMQQVPRARAHRSPLQIGEYRAEPERDHPEMAMTTDQAVDDTGERHDEEEAVGEVFPGRQLKAPAPMNEEHVFRIEPEITIERALRRRVVAHGCRVLGEETAELQSIQRRLGCRHQQEAGEQKCVAWDTNAYKAV